ncbi:MAG: glycosyltransferase [Acidimicrobiales bacterium]
MFEMDLEMDANMGVVRSDAVSTNGHLTPLGMPARLRSSLHSSFAGNGGLSFLIAMSAVNLSNFIFHIVISRMLGPASYGALGALLGIITVLTVPIAAAQAAITQAAAEGDTVSDGSARPRLAGVLKWVIAGGIGALGLTAASSSVIASYLHLHSLEPVFFLGLWLLPSIVAILPQGVLIGRLSFKPVGVALTIGAGGRLVAGVILVKAGYGVDGAMLGTAIGAGISCLLLLWHLRGQFTPRFMSRARRKAEHGDYNTRSSGREMLGSEGLDGEGLGVNLSVAGLSIAALTGSAVFLGIDTFLARHFLTASAAGFYAAAAVAARIALFLPSAIALIAFPHFVTSRSKGDSVAGRRHLMHAIGGIGLLGTASAIFIAAFPSLVVDVLFGSHYSTSAAVVGVLAVSADVMGLITLLVYYHLARKSALAALGWIGSIAAGVLIGVFHTSPESIAVVMLTTTSLVLAGMLLPAFRSWAFRKSAEPPSHTAGNMCSSLWSAKPEVDLTVVVPFFNPGERLDSHIASVVKTLEETGRSFEVIAVSDGSTDGSTSRLVETAPQSVQVVALPHNQGKGEALRLGMAMGRGRYVGFIDADGDIPAEILRSFAAIATGNGPDIVLGSKLHKSSQVIYPPARRLYSFSYRMMNRVLFNLNVSDTQTGVKLVRRDVLANVLPRMLEKRFAFDLELLVVAHRLGYRRHAELPVTIRERFTSTISLRAVRGIVLDTLAIFYRLRLIRYYDVPHEPPSFSILTTSGVTAQVGTP